MAKTIDDYKKDYAAARARGDAAGMQAANDGANAIRASQGQAAQVASEDIAKIQPSSASKTPTATSGTSSGGSIFSGSSGGSSGMSSSEILALGKGPLSSSAAANYAATGSTKTPTSYLTGSSSTPKQTQVQQPQKQVSVTDSPEYQALMEQLNQVQSQLTKKENDYSDYVRQLQEATKAKSLSELEAAYKKNVNAIDAAKGQIAPKYTDARNQAAGQAAVSRKNWQETASALGINSGAAGQSAIAQNIAMQNNLAALDKSETADMAALDLQKTQATTDYNSAIAQAEASGDYELAAALYQEKVRADETARADQATQFQQLLQRFQFEHGVSQDALTQENLEKSYRFQAPQAETTQQNQEFNKLLTLASSYAESTGDYSLFSRFGFTQEQIAAWNSAWAKQHTLELQQAYAKLASGSKTASGSTTPGVYTDPYDAMSEAGIYDKAGAYAWALNNGASSTEAAKLAEFFESRQPVTSEEQLGETARIIAGMAKRVTSDKQLAVIAQQIKSALTSGDMTNAEADYITKEILHYI